MALGLGIARLAVFWSLRDVDFTEISQRLIGAFYVFVEVHGDEAT